MSHVFGAPSRRTRLVSFIAALAMIVALIPGSPLNPSPADAATTVAFDMVNSSSLNLISYTDDPVIPFTSLGDGFTKYSRPDGPFAALDDSLSIFTADTLGIIGEANTDEYFAVVDTVNDDTAGPVTATWVFDITGATDLSLSIDIGAMGDFEAADTYVFEYSIDGGAAAPIFPIVVDESATFVYTMDSGTAVPLDDPLFLDGTQLTNNLATFTTPITGTGTTLTLTLTAETDSGSEAVAFQNIIIESAPATSATVAFDMVNSSSLNLISYTDDPVIPFTSLGDGFTKYSRPDGPFAALDDSLSIFTADTLGIIGEANTDEYFAVVDTVNDDTAGPVTATWVFDITGATDLSLSIDIGAMGDFEAADTYVFEYSIDGGAAAPIFPIVVDESATFVYTMDSGTAVPLDDPLFLDGTQLTNNLATFTTPITGTGTTLTLTLTAETDSGSEAVAFQNIIIESGSGGGPVDPPFGVCFDDTETLISAIQGALASSDEEGNKHVVEAVVVGDYQDADQLNGFFLQEEDADADANVSTSEGLFVLDNGFGVDVAVGDIVRAKGTVEEGFGQTQLEAIEAVEVCGSGSATAALVTLPVATDLEPYEGMSITIDQTLYATDVFNWHRNGEVTLSVDGVLDNPTNVVAPGAAALALEAANAKRTIQLDDGSSVRSPDLEPVPYIQADGTLRRGDTISGLSGVLGFSFGAYEVHPAGTVTFARVNDRVGPPDVGGTMQVGAFNVLNYFTTIDTGASICGPLADQGCRGADSAEEFTRQRDKIVDAIVELDAEILGLMEIENAADNTPEADLVAGLNAAAGAGTYDYVVTPGGVGADAIRVALLYQPGEVTPIGSPAILDSSVDPTFNDDKNRAVLAQTFEENATGERFTVAVNHFKSKGSACDDVGDPNAGDGQGNCNGIRTDAAIAQAAWLAGDPTGSGDPDSIVIGDLNAYAMEDPIVAFEGAGYTDLVELFNGGGEYSFVFFGADGYLDHAMSSPTLTSQVTGAGFWYINSDEPRGLDYNQEDNQPSLYNPDEWRSSDHDPVIVGLDMATAFGTKERALEAIGELLPTGTRGGDRAVVGAYRALQRTLDPALWLDENTLDPENGSDVFRGELVAVARLAGLPQADSIADTLVAVDGDLARDAIDEALRVNGDPAIVAQAEEMFARANDLADAGARQGAITLYERAWTRAQWAIAGAPTRFATYNASMNRSNAGDLIAELSAPWSAQPSAIAEVIQRTRPDVVLINEFDYDEAGEAAALFQDNYLSQPQRGADPIVYPYRYTAPSNTGVYSGFDLDNSGAAGDFVPGDSFGFGFFEGQFAFVVYSMYPIDTDGIRTFQNFLWKDMPGNLIPAGYYDADELDVFRLSSKNHVDLPIEIDGETIHFLVSHPTPPVFDGPEDRNGTRNHDEIRFWADYVSGDGSGDYIYDDDGVAGALPADALFVVAGDQNADPFDGDSSADAALALTDNARFNHSLVPSSLGGPEQAILQGLDNASHLGDPAYDTSDFGEPPGNLRVDYVLPSAALDLIDGAVFWPLTSDPLFLLVGASDHRMVWIDVK